MREILDALETVVSMKSIHNTLVGRFEFDQNINGLVSTTRKLQKEKLKLINTRYAHTNNGIKKHNQQVEKVATLNREFIQGVLDAHNQVSIVLKLMATNVMDSKTAYSKSFTSLVHSLELAPYDKDALLTFNKFRNIVAHNAPMTVIESLSSHLMDSLIVEFQNVQNFVFNFESDNEDTLKRLALEVRKDLEDLFSDED
jgi:uncharacterized protein YutE (UPF0331/DUF86 family)